jgi:hypothetical protein
MAEYAGPPTFLPLLHLLCLPLKCSQAVALLVHTNAHREGPSVGHLLLTFCSLVCNVKGGSTMGRLNAVNVGGLSVPRFVIRDPAELVQ